MFSKNSLLVTLASLFGCALLAQITVSQHNQIKFLQQEVKLLERENNIEKEEIRDLIYEISQKNAEIESSGIKHYVLGAVDAINKPDAVREIWHNGYDRGSSNQQYVDRYKEATYVDLKNEDK